MAFGVAAGYSNLPNGKFLPAIIAKKYSNSSVGHRLQKRLLIPTMRVKLRTLATQ